MHRKNADAIAPGVTNFGFVPIFCERFLVEIITFEIVEVGKVFFLL